MQTQDGMQYGDPTDGLPPDWDRAAGVPAGRLRLRSDRSVEAEAEAWKLLRRSPDAQHSFLAALDDCDLARVLDRWTAGQAVPKRHLAWLDASDGTRRWVLLDDDTAANAERTLLLTDVTDFMQRDLQRRVGAWTHDLLRYRPDTYCVTVHDERGRILAVNDRQCQAVGIPRDELLRRGLDAYVTGFTPEGLDDYWSRVAQDQTEQMQCGYRAPHGGTTSSARIHSVILDYGCRSLMRTTALTLEEMLQVHLQLTTALHALLGVVDRLRFVPRLEVLCGHAVRELRRLLDLERVGLFLVEGGYVRRFWDESCENAPRQMNLKPFPIDDFWRSLQRGENLFTKRSRVEWERPLYKHIAGRGVVCGKGWLASTPIHGATGLLGVLFHDTLRTRLQFDPVKQEIVEAFCPIFGSLLQSCIDRERRRRAEARVVQAERLGALEQTAATIAHDMNSILAPVSLLPDLICKDLDALAGGRTVDLKETRSSLDDIRSAAREGMLLVQRIMALGQRSTPAEKQRLEINDLLRRFAADSRFRILLQERSDIRFHLEPCPSALWVNASESDLRRVLANLSGNAIDAMHKGGTLRIQAQCRVIDFFDSGHALLDPGAYAVILVSDTGAGMTEEVRRRIFEPFFSTKQPTRRAGAGLGLASAQRIAQEHYGAVEVESQPGRGTTFSVYLPQLAADASITEDGS